MRWSQHSISDCTKKLKNPWNSGFRMKAISSSWIVTADWSTVQQKNNPYQNYHPFHFATGSAEAEKTNDDDYSAEDYYIDGAALD
jgi:hypothetical protein